MKQYACAFIDEDSLSGWRIEQAIGHTVERIVAAFPGTHGVEKGTITTKFVRDPETFAPGLLIRSIWEPYE